MNNTGPELENDFVLTEPLDRTPFIINKTPKAIKTAPKNAVLNP